VLLLNYGSKQVCNNDVINCVQVNVTHGPLQVAHQLEQEPKEWHMEW